MLIRGAPGTGPALPTVHRRLRWIIILVILGLGTLIGRLWQLQIVRGQHYYEQTLSNVVHQRYIPSIRGKILDRNGVALADNRPAFNLYVTPRDFTEHTRSRLIRMLDLTEEEVALMDERVAAGKKRSKTQAVMILEDQSRDRASLVDQSSHLLRGVMVEDEPYRFYPNETVGAHLVGYMNQMTSGEVDDFGPEGYEPSELIGRYGLESAWENYLRGKKGIETFAVNARGERLSDEHAAGLIEGNAIIEPVAGHNVVLTVDMELQRIAERAVARHPAAAVAVVEVDTGRVLALVSRPAFDPNVMTGHLTRSEEALLLADPRKPFLDKTLRQHYPPGSTYKFVTAVAGLEDGAIDDKEELFCPGFHEVGNQRFKCTSAHGYVDVYDAIKKSCNVYFWKLAERVGIDRMAEIANKFGFGARTGIGLNGDVPGRIPTRAWYEQHTSFKIGYTINAATGQGDVEVTVLQLVMAYAAMANGGTLYVPQVVSRVETAAGDTVVEYEPAARRDIGVSTETLDLLHEGMVKVVNELGGTAYEYGHSDSVTYAGKTGTAQVRKSKKKKKKKTELKGWRPYASHAWFAGYAPATDPEIAIVVLIEHGGPGGKVAGPVAKKIIEGYFDKVKPAHAPVTPTPPPADDSPSPAAVEPAPAAREP